MKNDQYMCGNIINKSGKNNIKLLQSYEGQWSIQQNFQNLLSNKPENQKKNKFQKMKCTKKFETLTTKIQDYLNFHIGKQVMYSIDENGFVQHVKSTSEWKLNNRQWFSLKYILKLLYHLKIAEILLYEISEQILKSPVAKKS